MTTGVFILTDILIQYIELAASHAHLWGFFLVFIFMTIESSFIPFPSEVVMLPAGFLAARGDLTFSSPTEDFFICVLAGTAGSLAGAFINYYLFRWLGKPFLERNGKYFFLSPQSLQRAEEVFLRYGSVATFVCRLLPGIRQLISIPAGISGMPIRNFAFFTVLGAGIWVFILAGIGFYLGKTASHLSYADLVHAGKSLIVNNYGWILLGCAIIVAIYIAIQKKVMASNRTV